MTEHTHGAQVAYEFSEVNEGDRISQVVDRLKWSEDAVCLLAVAVGAWRFSTRGTNPKERVVIHEFHTLSTDKLFPVTPENSKYQWKPERGIELAAKIKKQTYP